MSDIGSIKIEIRYQCNCHADNYDGVSKSYRTESITTYEGVSDSFRIESITKYEGVSKSYRTES
jgi:hypothetical protein